MITLFLVLLGGNETLAQTQRLVVWQKDGEKVVFDLSERPKTVFEGTDIVISTSTMTVRPSASLHIRTETVRDRKH